MPNTNIISQIDIYAIIHSTMNELEKMDYAVVKALRHRVKIEEVVNSNEDCITIIDVFKDVTRESLEFRCKY